MTTDATLTSKGQTTIPKEIRESLGLKARSEEHTSELQSH